MADGSGKKDSAREPIVRTVTYLAPGEAPSAERKAPTLDPELEKIREREVKALAEVKIDTAPQEPSIDPELVKIRDEQIKRERERATAAAPTATTTTDEAPAAKPTAKKSAKK